MGLFIRRRMLLNFVEGIARSDKAQIEKLLKAVLQRYAQLFPDYEVSTISLKKGTDRNQQIDQIIALLQQKIGRAHV